MKNLSSLKFTFLLLLIPVLFSACEKNHFKNFEVGATSGDGVQHRTTTVACVHPGTGGGTVNCRVDVNEDENTDINFQHRVDQGIAFTTILAPSGTSIAADSAKPFQGLVWLTELQKGDELSDDTDWYNLTSDVRNLRIVDADGDATGYFAFRWGTNTQRRYGWIKLRWENGTDYYIDEWAFQEFPTEEE